MFWNRCICSRKFAPPGPPGRFCPPAPLAPPGLGPAGPPPPPRPPPRGPPSPPPPLPISASASARSYFCLPSSLSIWTLPMAMDLTTKLLTRSPTAT
ncbi:hypothetical protein FJZ36_10725 [Candidatus Poribacteria bacterium]|nr:hypothetical protein [Candidatus Poribacteria bacterium]